VEVNPVKGGDGGGFGDGGGGLGGLGGGLGGGIAAKSTDASSIENLKLCVPPAVFVKMDTLKVKSDLVTSNDISLHNDPHDG
jgi:hypothetical protein